jgi:hypothetical protein
MTILTSSFFPFNYPNNLTEGNVLTVKHAFSFSVKVLGSIFLSYIYLRSSVKDTPLNRTKTNIGYFKRPMLMYSLTKTGIILQILVRKVMKFRQECLELICAGTMTGKVGQAWRSKWWSHFCKIFYMKAAEPLGNKSYKMQ